MKVSNQRLLGAALRHLIVAVALVGITALVTSQVVSQDKESDNPLDKLKGMSKEMAEQMQKCMEAGMPGEHHRHLSALAGEWKAQSKFRMTPESPWEESTATASSEMIFGGRFLKESYKDSSEEMPFEGLLLFGYNNVEKRYESVWLDSMGSSMTMSTGKCDPSGKVFTLEGKSKDPMGKEIEMKMITRVVNKDKHSFEMHSTGPDGKMFKSMEIVYTRK